MFASFPCPACGYKGTFEIISKTKDLRAMKGATCTKCGHVVTLEEENDWFFTVAAKHIKKALKKRGTGF